ncbi:MAG: GH1 family beta-glucosidase [Spirochaetota bacterium]
MPRLECAKDFVWGSATSAYQIEGACREDGKGLSIWDTFSHTKGKVRRNQNGDAACDHYHRYKEDILLMKSMGIGAYRFSLSWPRIFPEGKGRINEKGLDFYKRILDELPAAGIIPYATLYHWDLPQALQDKGGWLNRDTAYHFADYAQAAVQALGSRVTHWITLNEPSVHMTEGYMRGSHAPGLHRIFSGYRVAHNLLLAHGLGVLAIRDCGKNYKVGIANALWPNYPASPSSQDARAAEYADAFGMRLFLDPIYFGKYPDILARSIGLQNFFHCREGDMSVISQPTDFLGVNHYSRTVVRRCRRPFFPFTNVPAHYEGARFTDMNWEFYPEAFCALLLRIKNEYGNPAVYITENGCAVRDSFENGACHDEERISYMKEYIAAMISAMEQGANVKGYFAWSFMDNFEWSYGYSKRFGLVHVNFDTQERTVKDSGRWYSGLIRNGYFF